MSNELPSTVALKCPSCGRSCRGVALMESATEVVRRTCKCGKRWQVIVRPIKVARDKGIAVHTAEWSEVTGASA